MPDTPVHWTPHGCPKCGVRSFYVVQLPLTDQGVDLAWFSRACRHEWPVTRRDAGETTPRSMQETISR